MKQISAFLETEENQKRKIYFRFRSLSVCNILLDIDTNDLYFSRLLHASVRFLSTYLSAFLKKSKFCLTHRRNYDEETEESFQNNTYEFFHQLIFDDIGEEH